MNEATLAPPPLLGGWEIELPNAVLDEATALVWTDDLHRLFETPPAGAPPTHGWLRTRLHPDDRDLLQRALERSISDRTPGALEHRIRFDDGRTKFVEQRWQVLATEPGRPLRVVGTCREITQHR